MDEDVHGYHGAEIDVEYDSNRCIHVRECVEGLPAVFDTSRRPWVDPDAADADALAAVVERCPTGALQYVRANGVTETPPARNTVTAAANGPLYLRGDVELRTPDGESLLSDTRVGFCRCGHSENKPLCDNSHDRVFDAAGRSSEASPVGDGPDEDSAADGAGTSADRGDRDDREHGRLTVVLTRNGPARFEGEFDLRRDDGSTTEHDGATLCRCGRSDDKPFCDGTHASVGFTTAEGE